MISNLVELYRAENFPIFQNKVFDSDEEARNCATGNIVLVQDMETGLIYNREFQPDLMRYDSAYQNEQSYSGIFRQHLSMVAEVIRQHFSGMSLIEIGCGKGFFLEVLQSQGHKVIGLDPAYDGTNPSIIRSYYTPELGLKAEGIIMRHVLEHVPNPISFLRDIFLGNDGKGKIYIEVPCFDWILSHRAWFDIFYEHVNYFRVSDFKRLFNKIYETGHLFGGQYIYVVADLSTLKSPVMEKKEAVTFPNDFCDPIKKWANKLKENNANGITTAIWSAASKGIIFSLLVERAGARIDAIIDINPAKQGKYTPITAKRILSPEEAMKTLPPATDILIMNSNYTEEIRGITDGSFNCIEVDRGNI